MKIDTLKDLEAMLKICRKQGVESVKVDGLEIKLGDIEAKNPTANNNADVDAPSAYTEEQLLNWSVGQ